MSKPLEFKLIREAMCENLTINHNKLNKVIEEHIDTISKAKRIEDIMDVKKRIISAYVSYLPMHSGYCPFCMECGDDCDHCRYAKVFRVCDADHANSAWGKLKRAEREMQKAIETYWDRFMFQEESCKDRVCKCCGKELITEDEEDEDADE